MAKAEVLQFSQEEELLRKKTIQTIIETTEEILREHGAGVKKPTIMDRVALIIAPKGPIEKSIIPHGQIAQDHEVVLRSYGRNGTSKAFAITMSNIEGSSQTNPDQETDTLLIINGTNGMPQVILWNGMNDERKIVKENPSDEVLMRISHRLITAKMNLDLAKTNGRPKDF